MSVFHSNLISILIPSTLPASLAVTPAALALEVEVVHERLEGGQAVLFRERRQQRRTHAGRSARALSRVGEVGEVRGNLAPARGKADDARRFQLPAEIEGKERVSDYSVTEQFSGCKSRLGFV